MTKPRRHVAKHARGKTPASGRPSGPAERGPAAAAGDAASYLAFARPPAPDETARLPLAGVDHHPSGDQRFDNYQSDNRPFVTDGGWYHDDRWHDGRWKGWGGDGQWGTAGCTDQRWDSDGRGTEAWGTEAYSDDGWGDVDTIVFPAPGRERTIRSHRRNEPGRRAAFRVLVASAMSASGLVVALAMGGGGTPAPSVGEAARPRLVITPPATSSSAPPAPNAEPMAALTSDAAASSEPAAPAQARPLEWPQGVGPQSGTNGAVEATTPTTTTPAPTPTQPTTTPAATATTTPGATPTTTPGATPTGTPTGTPTTTTTQPTTTTTPTTTPQTTTPPTTTTAPEITTTTGAVETTTTTLPPGE